MSSPSLILPSVGGPLVPVLGQEYSLNSPYDDRRIIQYVITPAQLIAMDSSFGTAGSFRVLPPGTLPVPADGVTLGQGKVYILEDVEATMQYNPTTGVAYTTGTGDLQIGLSTALFTLFTTAQLKGTGSKYSRIIPAYSATDMRFVAGIQGGPIFLVLSTSVHYAAGNSPIVLTVRYRVITMFG